MHGFLPFGPLIAEEFGIELKAGAELGQIGGDAQVILTPADVTDVAFLQRTDQVYVNFEFAVDKQPLDEGGLDAAVMLPFLEATCTPDGILAAGVNADRNET